MSRILCPFAVYRPIGSHGGPYATLGLVEHVTTNHGDPITTFADPRNKRSSTWWLADDGTLEQYMYAELASWAQAAGNYQYQSLETSGTPDIPLTDAQVGRAAQLYRWGHDHPDLRWDYTFAEQPGQRGFGWHGMGGAAWGGHPSCPGELRKAQRHRIVNLAQGLVPPNPGEASHMITAQGYVAGIYSSHTGSGYYIVTDAGEVFAFGDAHYEGGGNQYQHTVPFKGFAPHPTDAGYWLVGYDGSVWAFGASQYIDRVSAPVPAGIA